MVRNALYHFFGVESRICRFSFCTNISYLTLFAQGASNERGVEVLFKRNLDFKLSEQYSQMKDAFLCS